MKNQHKKNLFITWYSNTLCVSFDKEKACIPKDEQSGQCQDNDQRDGGKTAQWVKVLNISILPYLFTSCMACVWPEPLLTVNHLPIRHYLVHINWLTQMTAVIEKLFVLETKDDLMNQFVFLLTRLVLLMVICPCSLLHFGWHVVPFWPGMFKGDMGRKSGTWAFPFVWVLGSLGIWYSLEPL